MKSPDRDAADELAMLKERAKSGGSVPYGWYAAQAEDLEKQASELATLRRRVAEMEKAAHELLPFMDEPGAPVETEFQRAVANLRIALSPPTRKE